MFRGVGIAPFAPLARAVSSRLGCDCESVKLDAESFLMFEGRGIMFEALESSVSIVFCYD